MGLSFVVFVLGVDWHALGKRQKKKNRRREVENIRFMSFIRVRREGFLERRDVENFSVFFPLGHLALGNSKLQNGGVGRDTSH